MSTCCCRCRDLNPERLWETTESLHFILTRATAPAAGKKLQQVHDCAVLLKTAQSCFSTMSSAVCVSKVQPACTSKSLYVGWDSSRITTCCSQLDKIVFGIKRAFKAHRLYELSWSMKLYLYKVQ